MDATVQGNRLRERKKANLERVFQERARYSIVDWIYHYERAILITVAIHLLAGIIFYMGKITVGLPPVYDNKIEMVLNEIEKAPKVEEMKNNSNRVKSKTTDYKNYVANENGEKNDKATSYSTQNDKLYQQALAQNANVLREVMGAKEGYNSANTSNLDNKKEVKEETNVTSSTKEQSYSGASIITFNMEGRELVYIDRPAYKCLGGGTIVIKVVINPDGKVLSGSVDSKNTTMESSCFEKAALASAKKCRFNADSKSISKQTGFITFEFIAQ